MPVTVDQKAAGVFTILVAEDNEIDRFFLERAYAKTELPHALHFVSDGEQAIDYLDGIPPFADRAAYPEPDLFLLDIKMPKRSGFDVLQWMKNSGRGCIPTLMLTGSDLDGDKETAQKLGALGYIVKSGNPDLTVKMFKEVCERWLKKSA